jgi:hypothetical protein
MGKVRLDQHSLQPGREWSSEDGEYFDKDGNPVRIRVKASSCPPTFDTPSGGQSTSGSGPQPLPVGLPIRTEIVRMLDELTEPRSALLRYAGRDAITIQPTFDTSGPAGVPECRLLSATLQRASEGGNRFEVTMDPGVKVEPSVSKALLVYFPDLPT